MGLDDGNLAGWHRDPSGRHELRFWDGDAWTEHVVDEGIPGLDYPTRSGRPPEGAKPTPVPTIDPPGAIETDDAPDSEAPDVESVTAEVDVEAEPVEVEPVEVEPVEVEPVAAEAEPVTEPVSEVEAEDEAPEPVTEPVSEVEAEDEAPEPVTEPVSEVEAEDEAPVAADLHPAVADADEPEESEESAVAEPAGSTIDLVAESAVDDAAASATDEAVDEPAADEEVAEPSEPAVLHTPLVASASVLAPGREAEAGADPGAPTRPGPPAGGRSLRSRRRVDPPVPPMPPAPERAPAAAADRPAAHRPIEEPTSDGTPTDTPEVEPPVPASPVAGMPLRLIADAPTVASPAGNSAGSNTSAIADPHRHVVSGAAHTAHTAPDATGPRVTGASPVPVKRYRPGSPPASPLAGPRALTAAATEVVGTIVPPWYRRASAWLTILAVGVVAALVVVIVGMAGDDTGSDRIGGRPPAAAPQGHKVIDGDGFGIAAPSGWIVATDPGDTFPQLRRTNWATPLAATDAKSGGAVLVVELHHLAHQPQVDPELFWTDQVKNASQPNTVTAGPPLSVHGFRANEITVAGPPGTPVVAASIDTGDRTFLVAVTGATAADAQTEFDRLIQTFDAR